MYKKPAAFDLQLVRRGIGPKALKRGTLKMTEINDNTPCVGGGWRGVRDALAKRDRFHKFLCRKLSGSAFSTVLVVKSEDLTVEGTLKLWERATDTGRRSHAYFCPDCGNRIYHQDPDKPHIIRIRSGSLDQPKIPEPRIHVFAERTQSWLQFAEGAIKYERQPLDAEELYETLTDIAE